MNQILGGLTGVPCHAHTGCPGSTNRAAPDPVGATRARATDQAEAEATSVAVPSSGLARGPRDRSRPAANHARRRPLFFYAVTGA